MISLISFLPIIVATLPASLSSRRSGIFFLASTVLDNKKNSYGIIFIFKQTQSGQAGTRQDTKLNWHKKYFVSVHFCVQKIFAFFAQI